LFLLIFLHFYHQITFVWDPFFVSDNELHDIEPVVIAAVPPILHQIYTNETEIPNQWLQARESCFRLFPDFEYRLWTDQGTRNLVLEHFPEFIRMYDSYSYDIQRAYASRFFILYVHGGIYLDLDIGCKRPIDNLRRFPAIFPAAEHFGIDGDLIMVRPRHPAIKMIIEALPWRNRIYGTKTMSVLASTGTLMVTDVLERYVNDVIFSRLASIADEIRVLPRRFYIDHDDALFFRVSGPSSWKSSDARVLDLMFMHPLKTTLAFLVFFAVVGYICWKKCWLIH
jgi:mannosyltransferase OCH1-like enzyme